MAFTDLVFSLAFLPFVFFVYLLSPAKARNGILLIASVLFYCFLDIKYAVFLVFSICVTYFAGKMGDACLMQNETKKGRFILLTGFCLNLSSLLICKYTHFFVSNINYVIGFWGAELNIPALPLPIGLSFYVFQSSTYLFDIYSRKTSAESSFLNYALFVSFFPTITSGPIQRSYQLLPQIQKNRAITWNRFQDFSLTFLWGVFLKLVVANRIAMFTNAVYSDFSSYGFFTLSLAAIAYSVQIYADFSGYSTMAIAIAGLFGFDLNENFARPYAATSIADFWRRWHISLSSWFRDYLYIPLGGNRKGEVTKYRNLIIVFLVSGLWHGASWNFILWGAIHALYQIIGAVTKPYRITLCEYFKINRNCFSFRLWQRIFVFFAVTFAWIFFRINSFDAIIQFFSAMFTNWDVHNLFLGLPASLGLDWITIVSVVVLLVVSSLKELGIGLQFFYAQNLPMRFLCYLMLILFTTLYGVYGPVFSASSFIYAGF